jgi:hypothetical protein
MSGQPRIRKGKWSPTEEAYTLRLMAEFKNGRLPPPIPEGTTLRQFLAQALNCDPLRISKKFAGAAQIGKVLVVYGFFAVTTSYHWLSYCAETLRAKYRFQRFGKSNHIDITTGLSLCIFKCAHLMLCTESRATREHSQRA